MALDYTYLKSLNFRPMRTDYAARETILHALSLGVGSDPGDEEAIGYCYEAAPGGLQIIPTQATIMGHPGLWARDERTGIDYLKLVHGEQRLTLERPLPAVGALIGRNKITRVTDKGPGRGAIVVLERVLEDLEGRSLATLQQVLFCRGDGGYSASGSGHPSDEPLEPLQAAPARPPDLIHHRTVPMNAALAYRLLADPNPLHADPVVARAAGFDRPILHGLATYGVACFSVLQAIRGRRRAELRTFDARFASPFFPGETLRTEIWLEDDSLRFQSRSVQRDRVVLSNGRATLM